MSRWITRAVDSRESVPVFQVNKYTQKLPSRVRLFATPWTVVYQDPLSMIFSRQEYGVGCHALFQWIFLPGIEPVSIMSPEWAGRFFTINTTWASLVIQTIKNTPAVGETCLGWKDRLEKGMATHCSILAWRISWREEPGGLQFMKLQRVGHDWATFSSEAQ